MYTSPLRPCASVCVHVRPCVRTCADARAIPNEQLLLSRMPRNTLISASSSLFPPNQHAVYHSQQHHPHHPHHHQHRQHRQHYNDGGSQQSYSTQDSRSQYGASSAHSRNATATATATSSKFGEYFDEWDHPDGELPVAIVVEHAAAAAAALGPLSAAAEGLQAQHAVAAAALEKMEAAIKAEADAAEAYRQQDGCRSDSVLSAGTEDGDVVGAADDDNSAASSGDLLDRHRAALALHVQELAASSSAASAMAEGALKRYASLRPAAIKLWGSEAAVQSSLIEEALGSGGGAAMGELTSSIASVRNVGHLAEGQHARVVHDNQFVDVEVVGSGDGGETWELASRFRPSALHPGAAPPPLTMVARRSEIYATVEPTQSIVQTPEHHLVPQASTAGYLLLMLADAEQLSAEFEGACSVLRSAAEVNCRGQIQLEFPGIKPVASAARKAAGRCAGRCVPSLQCPIPP